MGCRNLQRIEGRWGRKIQRLRNTEYHDKQYNIVVKSQDGTSKPGYFLSEKGHHNNHAKTVGLSWDCPGETGSVAKLEHMVPRRESTLKPDCLTPNPAWLTNSVASANSINCLPFLICNVGVVAMPVHGLW